MDLLAATGSAERDVGVERAAELSKRQRLVWTPQLHAQFIEAVQKLGVKTAGAEGDYENNGCQRVDA